MRHKKWFFTLILTGFLLVPCIAGAVATKVHPYECKTCHTAGIFQAGLGNPLANNVCITCHNPADGNTPHFTGTYPAPLDGQVEGVFSIADASNKYNSGITGTGAAADQTSHNWGAAIYNPAAGASSPTDPSMQSRYGASSGFVTCTRCHDPHGNIYDPDQGRNNPKLFYTGSVDDKYTGYPGSLVDAGWQTEAAEYNKKRANAMCVDCHKAFASPADGHGFGSHFTGSYGMDADPGYKTTAAIQAAASELKLIDTDFDGNLEVACVTCHGTHNTDSDATSTDGVRGNMVAGADGNLLRGDGAQFINDATRSTTLCNTCHNFESMGVHGSGPNAIGCLGCHGGHNYNDGNPSYYMLINGYTTLPSGATEEEQRAANWGGTIAGEKDGLCETCHGNLEDNFSDLTSVGQDHTSAGFTNCTQCHLGHTDDGGFSKPIGCTGCHGYAPYVDSPGKDVEGGFAYSTATGNRYNAAGVYKDESQTPHATHANGSGNYDYSCTVCHGDKAGDTALADHDGGTFQQVMDTAIGVLPSITNSAGLLTPTYTLRGDGETGQCNAVYCHSNGIPRGGAYKAPATAPVWEGGKDDILLAGNRCQLCHGNDATSMNSSNRDNSALHQNHLGNGAQGSFSRTYSCNVCHNSTAADPATLKTAAIGGVHVDGIKNVVFNSTSLAGNAGGIGYNLSSGACSSVYCHSDGKGTYRNPDWDTAASGNCDTCHGDTGDAVDNGMPSSNNHARHVTDTDGPQLGCSACHDTSAADDGSHANHIDGSIDLLAKSASCNPCHGAADGETDVATFDNEPVWGNTASVNCSTCHTGAVVSNFNTGGSGTYMDVAEFYNEGHGDAALTGAPVCIGCHDSTAAGHFDGDDGNDRLKTDPLGDGSPVTYNAAIAADVVSWCQECHASDANAHYVDPDNSDPANSCANCHNPHGEGMGTNTDVMLTVGENFTDRTDPTSYFSATAPYDGVCQTCHDPAEGVDGITHYNSTSAPDGHNAGTVCTQCHSHTSTPVAFAAGCTDCHGNTANGNYWPDSDSYGADNGTVYPNRIGSHGTHLNAISLKFYGDTTVANRNLTCNWCHPGGQHSGDQLAAPADLMNDPTTKFKNILGADNVQTSTVTQAGGNVSCSNVDCHYTATVPAADWYSSTKETLANCSYCHVFTGTYTQGTLPNAHDKHMGELADLGRNMDCANCHVHPGIDGAHQNGVIDINSTTNAPLEAAPLSTFVTAGSDTGTKFGGTAASEFTTCSNLECHGNFTGGNTANAPNWYNTAATGNDGACGTCHGSDAAATPTSNKHGVHLGSTTYVDGTCDECHTQDVSTHVYGTVDMGGVATVTYDDTLDNCSNACHFVNGADNLYNTGTLDDPTWLTANTNDLGCQDCHNGTKTWTGAAGADLNRGLPPVGDRHDAHNANAYIASDCDKCHSSNAVTHSPLDNSVEVDGNAINTFSTPNCTNDCHTLNGVDNTGGNADDTNWTDPDGLGCQDCHTNGLTGLTGGTDYPGSMYPSSGLHNSATALAHKGSIVLNTCTTCHDADAPTTVHANTVWQNAATVLYNFASGGAQINSYSHTDGCAANCHQDGGDWNRKWWNVVDAIPQKTDSPGDAVCDNCHGDFDNGWRYNVSSTSNTNHVNPYDQGGANPDNMDQHSVCQTCHGWGADNAIYNAAMSPSRGGKNLDYEGHMDGFITMNGPDEALSITSNVGEYGGAVTVNYPIQGAEYDNDTGGCAAACHSNAYVLSSNSGWGSNYVNVGSGACDVCHSSNGVVHDDVTENDTLHNVHNNSAYIDDGTAYNANVITTWDSCDVCHPHSGEFGGSTGHNNGTVNFANNITPASYDYTLAAAGDNGVFGGTCGNNSCHNSDAGEWQSGSLGTNGDDCRSCHGVIASSVFFAPLSSTGGTVDSAAHPTHVGDAANIAYGDLGKYDDDVDNKYEYGCGNCHSVDSADHINTTLNVSLSPSDAASGDLKFMNDSGAGIDGTKVCSGVYCHSDGQATVSYQSTPAWTGSFTGDTCKGCHGNMPDSNAHRVHAVGVHVEDIYDKTSTGVYAFADGDAPVHKGTANAAILGCQTCHNDTVTTAANDQSTACSSCHVSGSLTVAAGNAVISGKFKHVDGSRDVKFQLSGFESKAQLRDNLADADDGTWTLSNIWKRLTGQYKADVNSADVVNTTTLTATYNSTLNNCSNVACHNGNEVEWNKLGTTFADPTAYAPDCMECHTSLPK